MTAQLSLLDTPALVRKRKTLAQRWYDRIRPEIRGRYFGQIITADHVWVLMEQRPDLMIPNDLHHNCMGALFEQWECAIDVDNVVRSTRKGANGNFLKEWKII